MESMIYSLLDFRHNNVEDCINSLNVNAVGRMKEANGISNSMTRRDYYLIYVLDGTFYLENSNINAVLQKGDFVILSPYTKSTYSSKENEPIDYLCLHFTGTDAHNLLSRVFLQADTVYRIGVHEAFLTYWQRMYREFMKNDKYFINAVSAILTSTLILFSRYATDTGIDPLSLSSIAYINNYLNQELKINELAKMDNLSTSHYRALFKKTTGFSPNNYIINRRIEMASMYLTDTSKTIPEISSLIGYKDPYYFERIFKKKIGVTPAKYRKGAKSQTNFKK